MDEDDGTSEAEGDSLVMDVRFPRSRPGREAATREPTIESQTLRSGISVGSLGQYEGEYDIVQNVLAT